jgi:hypothetical protein
MERDFAIWREFDAVFLGRLVKGNYSMSHEGLVTVKTPSGSKTTQLGGSPDLCCKKAAARIGCGRKSITCRRFAFANRFAAMQRVFCFQESGS